MIVRLMTHIVISVMLAGFIVYFSEVVYLGMKEMFNRVADNRRNAKEEGEPQSGESQKTTKRRKAKQ